MRMSVFFISPLIMIFTFVFAAGCSTFSFTRDLKKESKRICLNSEGKGRLHVNESKYVFSFESYLSREDAEWKLVLDFPLHNPESFELDWSGKKIKFKTSLEDKILKENNGVNPEKLDFFVQGIGTLLMDIVLLQEASKEKLQNLWKIKQKKIEVLSKDKDFRASFTNPIGDSHFGLMTVSYFDKLKMLYKMELVVRKCEK